MEEIESIEVKSSFIDKIKNLFNIRDEVKQLNLKLNKITSEVLDLSNENKELKEKVFEFSEKLKVLYLQLQEEKDKSL